MTRAAPQHLGNVGLLDSQEISSCSLLETTILHDRVNFEDELRLDQMLFGIRNSEVLEYVSTSHLVRLLAHGFLPLAICSASRSRCSISSMSRRGVSRPLFDFF